MITVRTERTDVSRRIVYQTVPDHFVLALEPATAFTAWAAAHGAVVWSARRVHVCVRAGWLLATVLCCQGKRRLTVSYFRRYCVEKGTAVQPG